MKGDTNSCNISGIIRGEIKIKDKNGKKFATFKVLNKFQLSDSSPVVEGIFNIFAFGNDNVLLCEQSLKEGDRVMMSGILTQKKDEKSGQILVSLMPSHIRKESGPSASSSKKEDTIEEDDLPF